MQENGCGKDAKPTGLSDLVWINLAAMGFSLAHTLVDLGIVLGQSSPRYVVQQALLPVLLAALYTWWGWTLAKAVEGVKSGLVGLMAFGVAWVVVANGVTIIYCMPPCGSVPLYADTLHIGNLILGPTAAYFAYMAFRRISVSERRFAILGTVIVMLVFLVTFFALEASMIGH
ncbi:MAG: hypothetical protein ACR2JY_18905 [Chloroflexota bacterium]